MASNVVGVINSLAFSVIITVTFACCLTSNEARLAALYAAIPPVTPSKIFFPFSIFHLPIKIAGNVIADKCCIKSYKLTFLKLILFSCFEFFCCILKKLYNRQLLRTNMFTSAAGNTCTCLRMFTYSKRVVVAVA